MSTLNALKVSCERCAATVINGTPCHEQGCTGQFVYTNARGKRFWKWRIWSLDVWGNARDGYEVNDRSQSGGMLTVADPSDHDLIKGLKERDKLNKRTHYKSYTTNGDDMAVSVDYKGMPCYQLERK